MLPAIVSTSAGLRGGEFKRSRKVAESLIRVTLARTYAHVDVKIFGRAAGRFRTLFQKFKSVRRRGTARSNFLFPACTSPDATAA